MRAWTALFAAILTLAPLAKAAEKLTEQDRIELCADCWPNMPRSSNYCRAQRKRCLSNRQGPTTRNNGRRPPREFGPAGRVGDLVHITKVIIEPDKLVLQINGGFNGGRKWYDSAQVGGGIGGGGPMTPLGQGRLGCARRDDHRNSISQAARTDKGGRGEEDAGAGTGFRKAQRH